MSYLNQLYESLRALYFCYKKADRKKRLECADSLAKDVIDNITDAELYALNNDERYFEFVFLLYQCYSRYSDNRNLGLLFGLITIEIPRGAIIENDSYLLRPFSNTELFSFQTEMEYEKDYSIFNPSKVDLYSRVRDKSLFAIGLFSKEGRLQFPIGYFGFTVLNHISPNLFNIEYFFLRRNRRNGLCKWGLGSLIKCIEEKKIDCLEGCRYLVAPGVRIDNIASQKTLEYCGFECTGKMKYYAWNGEEYVDGLFYSLELKN